MNNKLEDEIHARVQITVEKMINLALKNDYDPSFYVSRYASPSLMKKYDLHYDDEMVQACLDWYYLKNYIQYLEVKDWTTLSMNETIPLGYILKNCENIEELDWDYISLRKDVTFDYMIENNHFPWDYETLTRNYNITWDIIFENEHIPWDYDSAQSYIKFSSSKIKFEQQIDKIRRQTGLNFHCLSYNKSTPLWFIEENMNKKWGPGVIYNPNITIEFMKKYPRPHFLGKEGWLQRELFFNHNLILKELEKNKEFFTNNSSNKWEDIFEDFYGFTWDKILEGEIKLESKDKLDEAFGYEMYRYEFESKKEEVYREHFSAKLLQTRWKNICVDSYHPLGREIIKDRFLNLYS